MVLLIISSILIVIFFMMFLSDKFEEYSFILAFALYISCMLFSSAVGNISYKYGQIDALKGKYRYEMKISYEKRLEYSIQDSIIVDSNGYIFCQSDSGDIVKKYYQFYYPDTIWEVVFIPIDTQFIKK